MFQHDKNQSAFLRTRMNVARGGRNRKRQPTSHGVITTLPLKFSQLCLVILHRVTQNACLSVRLYLIDLLYGCSPTPVLLFFVSLSVQSELPLASHQGYAPKHCLGSLHQLQLTQVSLQESELYAGCQHPQSG